MGSQQSVPERMFGNQREQLQLRDGTKFHFLHFRPSDSCKCAILFLCGLNLRSDDPNRNFLHSECAPRYGEQLGVECAIVTPLCPLTPLTTHWSDEKMQVRKTKRKRERATERTRKKEKRRREKKRRRKTRKRENKKREREGERREEEKNRMFSFPPQSRLVELVVWMQSKYERIALAGFSMGGFGGLRLLRRMPPNTFVACAFVASSDSDERSDELQFPEIPIRWYYGEWDDSTTPARMQETLVRCPQGFGEIICLPKCNHSDAGDRVFEKKDVYDWLFSHKKL